MPDARIARKYARALVEAVSDSAKQDQVRTELDTFEELFRTHSILPAFLMDRRVNAARKEEIAVKVAQKSEFSAPTTNLLRLLARHGRFNYLEAMIKEYQMELDRRRGILNLTVWAAHALSPVQHDELRQWLETATRKKVKLNIHRDDSLLGGMVLEVGSVRYDISLKNQLKRLVERLAA